MSLLLDWLTAISKAQERSAGLALSSNASSSQAVVLTSCQLVDKGSVPLMPRQCHLNIR